MSTDQYSTILFFENGRVSREMMYAEFEAILDSFVPLPEYAGLEVQAAYVQISPQIKIEAAVFFLIGFDGAGHADRQWNIPLVQLAEQGESGPNLGGGPIRLVCRSQCPVSWHVQQMWDPDMGKEPNDFVLIRDVVKRNKLGFRKVEIEEEEEPLPETLVLEPAPQPTTPEAGLLSALVGEGASETDKALSASLVQFLRKKLDEENIAEREELIKKQTLLLAAQKTKFDDELNKLEEQHSDELRQMQETLGEYNGIISEQKKHVELLTKKLDAQIAAQEHSQKIFEQKLAKSKESDGNQIELFKQNLQQEMERKIEAIAKEYSDVLAEKEMEISYRDEEKKSLQAEIDRLNKERSVLIGQGGEHFINRLKENQVSFVVYHQGAGHINIDIDAIGEYLSNPISFAAKSCKVSEDVYRQWLTHHENPVCLTHSEIKGEVCGKKLKLVVAPAQFVPGRSDRCPLHWSFSEEAK